MKILDCTLRDGGYINNWNFDEIFLHKYLDLMEKNKVDYVEIGFINKIQSYKNKICGFVRNLNDISINKLREKENGTLRDINIAVMGDYGNIDEELLKQNLNVDLVRVAFHKKNYKEALEQIKNIKEMGYIVSANPMGVTNYNEEELIDMLQIVKKHKLDYVYIADSYGSLDQNSLESYIIKFNSNIDNKITKIGLHLHNNMNNAFSNFEYVNNNIKEVYVSDSTLFGMGRGAGNLQTELVLLKIKGLNENFKKLLFFINEEIKEIFKVGLLRWGYEIDYLLSGFLKIHPNYVDSLRESGLTNNQIIEKIISLSNLEDNKKSYFNIQNLF